MSAAIAYIGLGGNMGDRKGYISAALDLIRKDPALRVGAVSKITESAALDGQGPDYLNAVAQIHTGLPPQEVLNRLLQMENALGRVRTNRWGSRNIDLDLLLYDDLVVNQPSLSLPHRQLHLRSFALAGLCEIDPDRIHPVLKEPMHTLARRLNGENFFIDATRPQLISIAGLIGVGKTTLTNGLAGPLTAEAILEDYDTNPYLPQVYAGNQNAALDSELHFLAGSAGQLAKGKLAAGKIYITDYIFEKARIYAGCWLDPSQLAEYEKIYTAQSKLTISPSLVLYLCDKPQNCLDRIHRRQRPYEQNITPDFLEELEEQYDRLMAGWKKSPVIRIEARDCLNSEQIQRLAVQIRYYLAGP